MEVLLYEGVATEAGERPPCDDVCYGGMAAKVAHDFTAYKLGKSIAVVNSWYKPYAISAVEFEH